MMTELIAELNRLLSSDHSPRGRLDTGPAHEKGPDLGLLRLMREEPSSADETLFVQRFWEPFTGADIESAGGGLVLASTPDCTKAGLYCSPRLVHADSIASAPVSAASGLGEVDADAFLLYAGVGTRLAEDIRCGIRTADCLTWLGVWQTPEKVLITGAHLGWRSLAAGLHFRLIDAVREHCPSIASFRRTLTRGSCHYFGPAVFGASYPCRMDDVGQGLSDLSLTRSHREAAVAVPEAAFGLATYGPLLKPHSSEEGAKCFPDLQLLCLLDLIREGVPGNHVLLHRVNTATSQVYPSHRWRHLRRNPETPLRLLSHVLVPSGLPLNCFPRAHF